MWKLSSVGKLARLKQLAKKVSRLENANRNLFIEFPRSRIPYGGKNSVRPKQDERLKMSVGSTWKEEMLLIQNHLSEPCNSIGVVLKYWVETRARVRFFSLFLGFN